VSKRIIDCEDLRKEGLVKGACCSSCHADYEDYDYPMGEISLPDGREAIVCCSMYWELDPNPEIRQEILSKGVK